MSDVQWASQIHTFYGTDPSRGGAPSMGPDVRMRSTAGGAGTSSGVGAGMGSMGAGHAGSTGTGAGVASGVGGGAGAGDLGSGSGISTDPRAGNQGDDTDLSRIRGSNIG
jgi:hypothetical protein